MLDRPLSERRLLDSGPRLRELIAKPRVIYTDVDATLLGPGGCLFLDSEKTYTLAAAEAVIRALEHGYDVVMVSGRHARQLHGDARILGFRHYIAELGCLVVYDLGEQQLLNVGDFPLTRETVYETISESGAPRLLFKHFEGRLEYHKPWSELRLCTHALRGYVDVDEANDVLDKAGFGNLKIVDNGLVSRRTGELRWDLPEVHVYHLLPKEAGKVQGVLRDRQERSIPMEETIAIGDAASDLELAPYVGAFFLVRTSAELTEDWLAAIAAHDNVFVADHAMGVGWAEAIHFLLDTFGD